MPRLAVPLLAALLAFLPPPVAAQTPAAVAAAEEALDAAWEAAPLAFRTVLYATDVRGFGVYTERSDNRFRQGEQIIVYAEPVGYGYRPNADGTYVLGVRVDLSIKTPEGEIVLAQNDFASLELTSHARNREFLLTLSLDISGAPVGDYVLEYLVHDLASEETAVISTPFSIVE